MQRKILEISILQICAKRVTHTLFQAKYPKQNNRLGLPRSIAGFLGKGKFEFSCRILNALKTK